MQNNDTVEAGKSLNGLKRICSIIANILKIILILLCGYWILAASSMLLSWFSFQGVDARNGVSLFGIFIYVIHGLVLASMLVVFINIFSNVAKGNSPFKIVQVKRLRLVAVLLLAYSITDLLTAYNAALIQLGSMNYGFISTNDSAIVAINFAPLIASVVVFAFSFSFKYGVLLQQFSDDTI